MIKMIKPLTEEELLEIGEESEKEVDMELHPDDDYFTWDDETGEETH